MNFLSLIIIVLVADAVVAIIGGLLGTFGMLFLLRAYRKKLNQRLSGIDYFDHDPLRTFLLRR